MNRSDFEKAVAAHYGITEEDLFRTITGLPMWAVEAGPEASKARRKWKNFINKCAADNGIALSKY